ncbi:hypothetical protein OPT61_g1151 [Boeremia exigua]|uniref:Uncharacterized protein n=1 Tax=Boeremia exigua TaxID=749465 RepID=A0ACC2IRE9_9PLEO|nr:hypothetical protein OPT61_g1151 [Boeremia exigua]
MSLKAALEEADAADAADQLCYQEIADKHGVSRSTLSRRYRRVSGPKESKNLNQQLLTPEEESELFLNRNQHQITSQWSTHMSADRHAANSGEKYKLYFNLLRHKITKYDVKPEHTYNMDEKGFMISAIGRLKRIFTCVGASGFALPPALVYLANSTNIQLGWVSDIDAEKHQVYVGVTPSGWSYDELKKAEIKELQAANKLYNEKIEQEKRQKRALEREERAKKKADKRAKIDARKAKRQRNKAERDAQKALQLPQIGKQKALQPTQPKKKQKRSSAAAQSGAVSALQSLTPPPKTNRRS